MTNVTEERVRYAETDQMGVTHHGTYLLWMEIGRTNLLRDIGLPYKELEERGVMLPVSKLAVKYILPTVYDDLITIHSTATELTYVKIRIDYQLFRNETELVCTGYTEHAIIDSQTRKVKKAPDFFREKIVIPANVEEYVNRI